MNIEVQSYKQSLRMSTILEPFLGLIWEFYVTHGICKSAGQRRTASDYNLSQLPLSKMLESAGIKKDMIKVLPANSINKTLEKLDLVITTGKSKEKKYVAINIDIPRIACLTQYSIADEESPKPIMGDAESILNHIRNSLAHGNIYLFPNGNMMLEDIAIDGKTITARMILHQKTLVDWIRIIDSKSKHYQFDETPTIHKS